MKVLSGKISFRQQYLRFASLARCIKSISAVYTWYASLADQQVEAAEPVATLGELDPRQHRALQCRAVLGTKAGEIRICGRERVSPKPDDALSGK
jgi:hypothetical protein